MASKGIQTSRQMTQRIDIQKQRRRKLPKCKWSTMMRPSLQIPKVEGEIKKKVIENLFNEIIAEKSTTLEKEMVINTQKIFRNPKRQKKEEPFNSI